MVLVDVNQNDSMATELFNMWYEISIFYCTVPERFCAIMAQHVSFQMHFSNKGFVTFCAQARPLEIKERLYHVNGPRCDPWSTPSNLPWLEYCSYIFLVKMENHYSRKIF